VKETKSNKSRVRLPLGAERLLLLYKQFELLSVE
jgi:hypothetical protein